MDDRLNIDLGGNYNPIKLDINGSSIFELNISKPRIEVLTDLLGKMIQFRESDLAKLSLIDRDKEITSIIDTIIGKIKSELVSF